MYTICDGDGAFICDRVTRDELIYLRGLERVSSESPFLRQSTLPSGATKQAMVVPIKRRANIWRATVEPSTIVRTLRIVRGICERLPSAEASATWSHEPFSNNRGSGRVYALNFGVSFAYPTTAACLAEHVSRQA